jgi:CHAT domain-containing protein
MTITIQDHELPPPLRYWRIQTLAERHPQRALLFAQRAMVAAKADDDPLQVAWAAYTLGWVFLCWERFEEARPHLQRACDLFAELGDAIAQLRSRHALLVTYQIQFADPQLVPQFQELETSCYQVNAPCLAASVSIDLARLYFSLGKHPLAEQKLDSIQDTITQYRTFEYARYLRQRGVLHNAAGRYPEAQAFFERAMQSFTELRCRGEVAKCWFELGWLAHRREQLDEALKLFHNAERVFDELDLPFQKAFIAKNVGLLLTRRGWYDLALPRLLMALQYFTRLQRIRDIGGTYLNLGNIYYYTARWETALAAYEQADALFEKIDFQNEHIIALRNRAMVCGRLKRFEDAHALLDKQLVLAEQLKNWYEVVDGLRIRGDLLRDQGLIDAALEYYERSQTMAESLEYELGVADSAMAKGWVLLKRGDVRQAQALFSLPSSLIDLLPFNRWQIAYGLARCAEMLGDAQEAFLHYREAIEIVAGLRSRLMNEEMSSSLYDQAAQLYTDVLRLAIAQGATELALEVCESQRALVFQDMLQEQVSRDRTGGQGVLRAELARLVEASNLMMGASAEQLDEALEEYGDLLLRARKSESIEQQVGASAKSFSLSELRHRLQARYGDDWSVVSYTINNDTLSIFTITPDAVQLEQRPFDRWLKHLIDLATREKSRHYVYTDLAAHDNDAQPWSLLQELAERLLPSYVQERLHEHHRLLIVPAGRLYVLPWAALRVDGMWLAERAIVQVAPALLMWQIRTERLSLDAPALLLGCHEFGSRAHALRHVGDELKLVAGHWCGDSEKLLDKQATAQALLERAQDGGLARYGLLHIASHAHLLHTQGRMAHLKLWDRDLLLTEIMGLQLDGALTVLSACDGAAADVLQGDEALSLSWAFLSAGASGVLASLWKLNDELAAPTMGMFYDLLRQHGDAGLALAQVQRHMIATHDSRVQEGGVLTWGSLVLIGASHFAL